MKTVELAKKGGEENLPVTKMTPMMEQYIEIKSANPDSLLFYRMGDFYELFFDDAIKASHTLGITLTKRGRHQGEDIPMCGVPVHCADEYLQKLIAHGYRVAVCEQIEDPAEAKKRGSKSVVRRDVIRLITPGTVTEDNLLDPSEANYLMAVGQAKGIDQLALAWIDISTGIFRVGPTTRERLLTDIMRVNPSELIISDNVVHEPEFKTIIHVLGRVAVSQPPAFFDSTQAINRITSYYKVATLDGFAEFSRPELAAISAIIAYLEKTQINERPFLKRPEREAAGTTVVIDPSTRQNLELLRTLNGERDGCLLKAIDRTVTGAGARLLTERLVAPLTRPQEIDERLDSVAYLVKNFSLTEQLRQTLKGGADMPRALSRLSVGRGGPRDLATIKSGIETAHQLIDMFADHLLPLELADAVNALKSLPITLYNHLDRALGEELPLLKKDGGFVRRSYSVELDDLRSLRDESRRVIANLQSKYAEETGIKTLRIKYNNILGYFIEVTTLQASGLLDRQDLKERFIHRQTMASAKRFTTTELAEMETRIAHAAEKALAIELSIFEQLCSEVVEAAELILSAATAVALIDVSAALAFLAEEQGYCRPVIDDSLHFTIKAGRHPVVEQALRRSAEQPFIANDCELSPLRNGEPGGIWLLTGPNMGGKSTFLRQNALIVILAQMGSFVPAGSAHIGVVDRLFSRVGASDDLARGRSTFMVEMVETAAILNQSGQRSLVILDEIGRGTATYDGLSIAWACVEYLHEVNRCRAIFATHFHEMTALSSKLLRLQNFTMNVKEWNGDVIFLHEVVSGVADRSYGVQVAKLAGLPDAVLGRARDVLSQLEKNERVNKGGKIIDDLPLFSQSNGGGKQRDEMSPIIDAIKNLQPDEFSPKDALEELYRLKNIVSNAAGQ